MVRHWILFFYVLITSYEHGSNACSIIGIPSWLLPENVRILDTHDGVIYNRTTTGIAAITSVTPREGLNGGPYVDVSLRNSDLIIETNANFTKYEELETVSSIGFSINFQCNDGSSRLLVFSIDITDTNNHDPVFQPSNSYEYTIAPPVPPNYLITDCISNLIVRDIDLTTERIDFTLQGSSLFEIVYDNSSLVPKEFKAILKTTTFIRSISEPITFSITATDVDRTGDPRRTATATVKILADSEFSLPDEPIFSQPFYKANYTTEHKFILQDSIYLRQGYDSQVNFTLEGQFSENFKLISNGNEVTFNVVTELNFETLEQREIYLIVKAERELTSGANAMIVLQLPEARELSFEKPSYSGFLEKNVTLEAIILNAGYNPDVTFNLTGQYADLFALENEQGRVVIGIKEQLPENILKENNFLKLALSASAANAIPASTTIFLEVIKNDFVTPVFSQNIYKGIYLNDSNVNFQSINLLQGYDKTVTFDLVGDYANFFAIETDTNNIKLSLNSSIPEDVIFNEKTLLLNIIAEKPRTVGANTAIALKFPKELTEPTILKFTKNTYNGLLENGKLTVEDVILEAGYTSQINFTLNDDFNKSFVISNTNNIVTIALSSTVSTEELEKNRFVVLEIEAARERAVPVTTTIIIDIPKVNIVFPVFAKPFYRGSYTNDSGLEFTEEITLQMGYDSSVTFSLEGVSSQWFYLIQKDNVVTLSLNETNPIPEDVLDKDDDLLFAVVANKPETIGGRAAIHINLPKEIKNPIHLQFEKNNYVGRIENGSLQLEEIRLVNVAISTVELNITGEFASYFRIIPEPDVIKIQLLDIPEEIITNNNFIILNIEASQVNAFRGHTTIVLDIIKIPEPEIISPIFEQTYYTGEYSNEESLIFLDTIKLVQGFDDTVSFELEGDSSQWFNLVKKEENSYTLSVKNDNLHEVTNKSVLIFTVVAHKTNSESARAAIIISLRGAESLDFSRDYYIGYLEDETILLEAITLQQNYTSDINLTLRGDYVNYFQVINNDGIINLRVKNEIPDEITQSINLFVLSLEAKNHKNRAQTTIVLEIRKDINSTALLNFEEAYYIGSYSETQGLNFETQMRLVGEFDKTVLITLEGENSVWFSINISDNSITLSQTKPIENSDIINRNNFVFTIKAEKENINTRATIIIEILKEVNGNIVLAFEQTSYIGSINSSAVILNQITLNKGYSENVSFTLRGEFASYFKLLQDEATITLALNETLPEEILSTTEILVLDLKATAPNATSAIAIIVLDVKANGIPILEKLYFDRTYYSGHYTEAGAFNFTQKISLASGYDNTTRFTLEGAHTEWFQLVQIGNSATLRLSQSIPPSVLAENQVLILEVHAEASSGASARTVIVISHDYGLTTEVNVFFDKILYSGKLQDDSVAHDTITISGYNGSTILITGEYSSLFEAYLSDGIVTVRATASAAFPTHLTHIALTLQADRASAVLLLAVANSDGGNIVLAFEQTRYIGSINSSAVVLNQITLTKGYSEDVSFTLRGELASFFKLLQDEATITLGINGTLPEEILSTNEIIVLDLKASAPNATSAVAIIVLDVKANEIPILEKLNFDRSHYTGHYSEAGVLNFTQVISLASGYDNTTKFTLEGAHTEWFQLEQNDNSATLSLSKSIPPTVLAENQILILEVRAEASSGAIARTVIVISHDYGSETEEAFDKVLYNGKVEDSAVSHDTITISGYNGTNVQITGVYASSFEANLSNGIVTVRKASSALLPAELTHTALTLRAGRASAALLLDVVDSGSEAEETFDKILYNGKVVDGAVSHDTITISGYSGTNVQITGAYESSFEANLSNGIVTVRKASSALLPAELTHTALTLRAGRARAVLLLDVVDSGSEAEEAFDKIFYNGKVEDGAVSHDTITISGYSGTIVQIAGAYASSFEANLSNGIVTVRKASSALLPVGLTHTTLTLRAGRASAVLLLDVVNSSSETEEAFDKVLYNGKVEDGAVSHDTIIISGYSGNNIQITGAFASSFEANLSNGIVTVRKASSALLPAELTHTALTLRAGRARAVLLLDVVDSGATDLTQVTFSKSSYFLWVNVNQTGLVGRVKATATNNEVVLYSLQIDDDNLRERISITYVGEILLLESVQSGVHDFIVTATAQNSRVNATASVLLRVEALPECNNGSEIGLPPLIVLERPEEEPHRNLVVFDQTNENCRYNLLNSWPADQSWLYIDSEGLHARAIDREHESIAFMTLSQIQVELILECDSDEVSIAKRSLNTGRFELGSDNYGTKKWILADTIEYDARRSFVNLIVNDINDNPPIFTEKDNEPVYVGFPLPELENTILPRALAELKATDADLGENAALIYWSTENNLAVAPQTGSVHLRNNASLENNSRLTVYATDLNGRGLNGTLDIVVKLLDKNQIAVITVRNAFLDDEGPILRNLSNAVGYEIKVLRTVIISENDEDSRRKRRDVASTSGASLQLYVYGLHESEPVNVNQLTSDINNSNVEAVTIARVLSLEDHLESIEICPIPDSDIALLVSTIVLAVLLLLILLAIALWFILARLKLKRIRNQNYDQFDDSNSSTTSRNNTMDPIPKVEIPPKPRLNIEELKRSERRLQEMLDTPIKTVEPENIVKDVNDEIPTETIVDITGPAPMLPIVIQSIDKLKDNSDDTDDEDEFGEQKEKRRKSVVTFNENVEKIIHLEDDFSDSPEPNLEIYKF